MCAQGGERVRGDEQLQGPGAGPLLGAGTRAGGGAQRAPGLGAPDSLGGPAELAQRAEAGPFVFLHHLGSFQKTRSSWLKMGRNQPTRWLQHKTTHRLVRHVCQAGVPGRGGRVACSAPPPSAALEASASDFAFGFLL